METKSLFAKLHAIMTDLDYIQKDKTNSFHRYNYASEAAIKEAVHNALVKHRVLFLPTGLEVVNRETGLGKDSKEALTTVRLSYVLQDVDSQESFRGSADGTGADPLDKGVYKAITGAIKYALTATFLIPTGDDPEDNKTEERQPERPPQVAKPKPVETAKVNHTPATNSGAARPAEAAKPVEVAKPAEKPAPTADTDPLPNAKEKLEFYARVRTLAARGDDKKIKDYVVKAAGAASPQSITKSQYERVLSKMEPLTDEELNKLVTEAA